MSNHPPISSNSAVRWKIGFGVRGLERERRVPGAAPPSLKRPPVGRGWQNAAITTVAIGRPDHPFAPGDRVQQAQFGADPIVGPSLQLEYRFEVFRRRDRVEDSHRWIAAGDQAMGPAADDRGPWADSVLIRRAARRADGAPGTGVDTAVDHQVQRREPAEKRIAVAQLDPLVGQFRLRIEDVQRLVDSRPPAKF